MMSEEHTENGRINDQGEEEVNSEIAVSTPDINSPRPSSLATPPSSDPVIEFFDQKVGVSDSGSEGEGSPRTLDNVSHHSRSYVTVSPSVSPGISDADSAGRDDSQLGYEHGPGEVVKPKPLPRMKPRQFSNGDRSGEVAQLSPSPPCMGQDVDLKVEVTEREKVGVKSDAYIRYKICTESSRPANQYEKERYEVWRRYRDFEWLREILERHHFTLIVPPLPGKQLTRYFDQKSEEFLDERQRALDKFLKRLSAHPYFSFSKHLKMFITTEPAEFASYVADTSGSNKLLGAVTSSVKMAANTFRLKNPDPEYIKEAKYFEEVGEKLSSIEKVATRLHSEREELASHMEDQSTAISQWALNERQLVDPIRDMATCIENCTSSLRTLNENNAYSLMLSAREYQLFCGSGVSAVRRRDGLQLDKERAAEERAKRKKLHDDAANVGKLQKLPKLADDLQKAGVEAERTLDDLSIANEQLRVDVEKWKEEKDKDITNLMTTFADNHINHHQKCFDEWGKVLSLLRGLKTPNEGGGDDDSLKQLGLPLRTGASEVERSDSPKLSL